VDDSDSLTGRVVADRYRVGERIGLGGMAEVRRAQDLRLDRPVALKFLDPSLAAQPDLRRRFEDEARAAARLNHPSVVQVFDSGEWEGQPFLVMELLSGRTFADEMAGGPLPVARVRTVAADVLDALDAAHASGVLHRDVKPANLLVADGGTVKIADFGIAKADPIQGEHSASDPSPPTMTGQLLGTPSYLPPERVAGHRATPASDVWALGVVLWEALAGRRAFPGNGIQTAMAVASTDLAPVAETRPDADPALARAVDVAVRRDPAQRWASAAAMRNALLEGAPADARVVAAPTLAVGGLGTAAAAGAGGLGAGGLGAGDLLATRAVSVGGASAGAAAAGAAAAAGGVAAGDLAASELATNGGRAAGGAAAGQADRTIVRPPPARAPVAGAAHWAETNRAGAFGLVAIAVVAGIIALVALAGSPHKHVAAKNTANTVPVRASVSTTTTSTSTSTTTTTLAVVARGGKPKGGGGGGDHGDGG
jgi:serine/threonine-protein kinase